MEPQRADLPVQIVRFVMEHQPPIVACEFVDADGHQHTVIDKVWIFTDESLDAQSQYPQPGVIRCSVLAGWRGNADRELVKINTADPFQIESTEGLTEFIVQRNQILTSPRRVNLR